MASTQTSLKPPFKDLTSFKGNLKRLHRERLEDAPIKKRVMAEMNLNHHGPEVAMPRTPKVKRERVDPEEEDNEREEEERGGRDPHQLAAVAKALDLSPGLKHTLAQFTLSSQSSLGGPAAFSAKTGRESGSAPPAPSQLPSPPVPGGGPLLVPCDSSTELAHALLEGESISCFAVGGEKRLCLPQVLNSVLRDFSLQQINAVCDELYVYCSRCDAEQLHILKVLGILPFNAPSCGLITLTDAQRLCNALLRPGNVAPAAHSSAKHPGPLLQEGQGAVQVEHRCLGKCQGLFAAPLYVRPDAPCVQCLECRLLFSPQNFVMHSHKAPDKRTCHWGFDSAKWPCYLQLGRKHQGGAEEQRLQQLLDEMKEKFHYHLKRPAEKRVDDEDVGMTKPSPDLCSTNSKLLDNDSAGKGKSSLVFNRLFPDIKEEPAHTAIIHPSYYLYTYDKMVAPNVSLRKESEASAEILGALLKQHYSRRAPSLEHEPAIDLHASPSAISEKAKPTDECGEQPPAVAMEMGHGGKAAHAAAATKDSVAEDDKDRIVLEIVQMYSRQQEKLNSTLQKQLQLEMELEALRGGEAARLRELSAEQRELEGELRAVTSEQAQRLGRAHHQQRQLQSRLEQLRRQSCVCDAHGHTPAQQEAQYTAQLCELRSRLEHAETERQELQEELRREKEARQKLELLIGQLQLQLGPPPSPRAGPPGPDASGPEGPQPSPASG